MSGGTVERFVTDSVNDEKLCDVLVPVMYEWLAPRKLSTREREVAEELALPTEHVSVPSGSVRH